MKIISRIYNFFFGSTNNESFPPTEEEIEQLKFQEIGIESQEEAEEAADTVLEENEKDEEENSETCEICGKTFYGEHAAQKKGGHKASGH